MFDCLRNPSDSRWPSKWLCDIFGNLRCYNNFALFATRVTLFELVSHLTCTVLSPFQCIITKGIKRRCWGLGQKMSLLIQYTFAPLIVITSSLESKNIAGPGRPGRPRRPFGPINPSVPFCPLAVETKDNIILVSRRSLFLRCPHKAWKRVGECQSSLSVL